MDVIRKGIRILREEGFTAFIEKSSSYTLRRFIDLTGLRYVLALFIARELTKLTKDAYDIQDAVAFAFSFKKLNVSIKPTQVKYEIVKLLELAHTIHPRVILEVGTADGGSLFLFTRVAQPDATIISIDLPGGKFGGGYPKWKIPIYKAFAREGQRVFLIREDSHNPNTLEKVKSILKGEKVDLLFIDGDHTYEGVKKDFEMYSPLVKKGGIIALHDICSGPKESVGGVPIFWNEIKCNFVHDELVKDWWQGGYGIGIIYL